MNIRFSRIVIVAGIFFVFIPPKNSTQITGMAMIVLSGLAIEIISAIRESKK